MWPVAEGLSDDLPLDGVGVLELVHEHHPVTFAQPEAGHWPPLVVIQGVGQADQEVVVGEEVGVEQAAP